ncbi:MAG: TetR/AcrR family transcriptional regulator [Roseburia sp.]
MPKVYSEEERNHIISRLKEEANILMQEKGVKKTTVDELVRRVGIPKGTFYLFYPSKELLLFDVSQDFHEQVDAYLNAGIMRIVKEKNRTMDENIDFSDCVEELTDVILGAMQITYSSCLQVLLNPESMNLILSKLPDDVLEKHRQEDRGLGEGIFEELAEKKGLRVEELVGAFMMIIFGGMYKREVGEENWCGSMRTLIRGLVLQLVG